MDFIRLAQPPHFILLKKEQIETIFFAGIQVLSGAKSWVGRNVLRRRAGAGESQNQKKVDGNPKQEKGPEQEQV